MLLKSGELRLKKLKFCEIICSNVLNKRMSIFKKFPDFIFLHFELMQIKFHSGELFGNTGYPVVTQPSRIPKDPRRLLPFTLEKGMLRNWTTVGFEFIN